MVAFVNPLSNIQAGQQWVNGLFQQQAQNRAGRSLAVGDQAGAANAFFNAGDVNAGLAMQQNTRARQFEDQDRARAEADRVKAEQLGTTRQVITALSRAAANGDDVGLLLEEFRPTFAAMGTPPEEYERVAGMIRQNPAIIDQFGSLIDREIQVINLGNGGWASVDKATGQRVAGNDAYIRPTVVGDVALGPDGTPLFDARRPEYFETESGGAPVIVGIGPQGRVNEAWRGEASGPEVRTLSADEVVAAGLTPGVYQQRRDGTITPVSGQAGDRLSAGQARQVETYYQDIAGIENINAELGRFRSMIEGGSLDLNPAANTIGGIRNTLGVSNENSRNLAEFRSTLERVRNDSLRLNSGVQTEGDAQRAWNELVSNLNDEQVVLRQLRRIEGINERARRFREQRIQSIEGGARQQQQPTRRSRADGPPIASRQNPYRLNPENPSVGWNRIPVGGYYIHPRTGEVMRKTQ